MLFTVLCRRFPWSVPFPTPRRAVLMRRPSCLIRGTIRSRIARNRLSRGLTLPKRYTTLSVVNTEYTQLIQIIVPAITKLSNEDIPVTFALSLHAPDDGLRDELIPVNSRWKVDEALDAARAYFDKTGRRVSIEYALIKDMNDHAWRADLLAEKLNARGRGWVHVNPIPLNPTPGSIWTASEVPVQNEFVRRLNDAGIPTTLRDTRGKEIDGACGQLVATEEDEAAAAETPVG